MKNNVSTGRPPPCFIVLVSPDALLSDFTNIINSMIDDDTIDD